MNFFQKLRNFVASPSHSRTMGIVIMLVLVSAVSLTVIVAQQQQTTKQRAAEKTNECVLDYGICDSGYQTRNNNCNQPIAPTVPNQADYQTDEEYRIAYDTYKTNHAQYQTDYSNCTESSRKEYETCKQNAYNAYLECFKNQSSAPATPETPTPTATTPTIEAPPGQSSSVPACWKCKKDYSNFFNNSVCNSICGETSDKNSACYTADCNPPPWPQLVSPGSRAVIEGSSTQLSWSPVEQGGNLFEYRYFVSQGQTDSLVRTGTIEYSTTATLENLIEGNTYSWKIMACIIHTEICSNYSPIGIFTVASSQTIEPTTSPTNVPNLTAQPTTPPITPTVAKSIASCPNIYSYNDLISAYKNPASITDRIKPYLVNGRVELFSFSLLKQEIDNCPK